MLEQVLDELLPDREKKPLIKILKEEPEEPVRKPIRKGMKSANRIVLIDRKAANKEQLLIPKAVLELDIHKQSSGPSFAVSNVPYD